MSTSFLDGYLQPSEVAAPLQVLCWQVLVELWVCPILECEETFEAEHVELEFADGALIQMLGAVAKNLYIDAFTCICKKTCIIIQKMDRHCMPG